MLADYSNCPVLPYIFMNRFIKGLGIFLVLLTVVLFATSSFAKDKDDKVKVNICHRTDSVTNPYEVKDVDASSTDAEGHAGHTGPIATSQAVAQALKDAHNKWGDIIPPAPTSGVVGGLNWDADGQAIYNNGCKFAVVNPTPTPTPTPTQDQHYECVRNACTLVNSAGANTCSSDGDCVTPTPTPTPTNTPSNPGGPGDGRSDGRSDGLSSCPSCTQAPQGQVLGASTGPAVLGLSTTDSGNNIYISLFQILAALAFATAGFKISQKHA